MPFNTILLHILLHKSVFFRISRSLRRRQELPFQRFVRLQRVESDFVQIGIGFGNVERFEQKADYVASRYAVLKDRIESQFTGEKKESEIPLAQKEAGAPFSAIRPAPAAYTGRDQSYGFLCGQHRRLL